MRATKVVIARDLDDFNRWGCLAPYVPFLTGTARNTRNFRPARAFLHNLRKWHFRTVFAYREIPPFIRQRSFRQGICAFGRRPAHEIRPGRNHGAGLARHRTCPATVVLFQRQARPETRPRSKGLEEGAVQKFTSIGRCRRLRADSIAGR